jgi:hypothetical protein
MLRKKDVRGRAQLCGALGLVTHASIHPLKVAAIGGG